MSIVRWKNVKKLKCPQCGSTRLYKDGIAYKKQRYCCKKCGRTTIVPKGLGKGKK